MTDRSKTVVMLIDWDNLQICHSRDAPGTELDLQALIALAQSYGTLVSARAYAEWNLLSERLAVYKAGIEPVFAPVMRPEGSPREGKSLADTVMVADGVDLLWTVAPDVFVLATSDKDMIPLARIAKQRGAAVVVLGSDLTAIPLVEMSNVFITYRQLLRELDRVSELEAPVGRAPARERRLRESRRPSSEPYGGGLGTGGGALGGGQFGAGGRGGPRPVGSMGSPVGSMGTVGTFSAPPAAPAPLPAPSAPRRRYPEPAPVIAEPERTVISPAAAAPAAPVSSASDLADEPLGIGAGDVAPRRRRRRGGRGRRSGIGGLGDGDLQNETLHDAVDDLDEAEADDEGQAPAVAAASSPDDIDNAVLQLLAARDREQSISPSSSSESAGSDSARSESTGAPASEGASASESATESAPAAPEPAPAPVRRVARTSFSSFGPPEVRFRSAASAREPEAPASFITTPPAASGSASESAEGASPEQAVAEGIAPDTVVSEAIAAEPIPLPSASSGAQVGVGEDAPSAVMAVNGTESNDAGTSTEPTASAEASSAGESASGASDDDTPALTTRSTRSSRSGRGGATRRSRGSSTSAAAGAASAPAVAEGESPADDSGDAARAPRRRRTRRPAPATSEGSSENLGEATSSGEAVTSEASV